MLDLIARWMARPPHGAGASFALLAAGLQSSALVGQAEPRGDAELVAAIKAGDRDALALLIERHYDAIYRLSYKWCGRRADAQDIAQEVCLKLVRKLHTFRGTAAFKTWLFRLVLNTAKDAGRRWFTRQRHAALFEEGHPAFSTDPGAEPALAAARILSAIGRLPSKQKQAALLVWAEGFSHREAAGIMGCRESTVSWHLHKARKTLKPQLELDP
jgi:RNA polymerase sigma-70 factor (ECF subfamily)